MPLHPCPVVCIQTENQRNGKLLSPRQGLTHEFSVPFLGYYRFLSEILMSSPIKEINPKISIIMGGQCHYHFHSHIMFFF